MTSLYSLACWNFHNHINEKLLKLWWSTAPLMLKFLGMYLREIIDCVLTGASIQLPC